MASASDFYVATLAERLPILSDQIVKHNVYLNYMRQKGKLEMRAGGDGFTFPVRKSSSGLVRAIGDWTVGQAKTSSVAQRVTVPYRAYGAEIQFSRLQMKRNQYADRTGFDYKFADEQLNEAWQDFENYIGVDIVADGAQAAGDEGPPIDGLVNISDDNNTYLGIDRTAAGNEFWKANKRTVPNNFLDDDDSDGVVNGLFQLRLAFLDACKAGVQDDKRGISRRLPTRKTKPDMTCTNQTTFNNYCTSLQPQQQYISGKNDPGQETSFFGIPLMWDTYAPADRIDILNSRCLSVRVVGDSLIYVDIEDELGLQGTARVKAIGLVSQLQHFCTRPSLLAFVENTD